MPRKEIPIEEVVQNVIEDGIFEELRFDPVYVPRFYVSNVIQRSFAHLYGWTGKRTVRVKTTEGGALIVAPYGTAYQYNDTKSGDAPNDYGTPLVFDQVVSKLDIFIWDNPAIVQRSLDGTLWQDEIEIPANTVYSFDCTTHSVRIKNKTAGLIARYQIIGWW
jgi:hypothetical protein